MSKRKQGKVDFWRVLAKGELALQRELGEEFYRHEEAMRKIIIKMRVGRPVKKGTHDEHRNTK